MTPRFDLLLEDRVGRAVHRRGFTRASGCGRNAARRADQEGLSAYGFRRRWPLYSPNCVGSPRPRSETLLSTCRSLSGGFVISGCRQPAIRRSRSPGCRRQLRVRVAQMADAGMDRPLRTHGAVEPGAGRRWGKLSSGTDKHIRDYLPPLADSPQSRRPLLRVALKPPEPSVHPLFTLGGPAVHSRPLPSEAVGRRLGVRSCPYWAPIRQQLGHSMEEQA